MNEKVRNYLIGVARQRGESFVYYSDMLKACGLDFDLGTPDGQFKLKQTLIEVSTYEHKQMVPRPLLSALAIGKTNYKHGHGFYDLAEELGFGKSNELEKADWGFEEAARCREFWKSEEKYEKYAFPNKAKPKTISELFVELTSPERNHWADNWLEEYWFLTSEIKKLRIALMANPDKPITDDSLYASLDSSIASYQKFTAKWLKEKSNGISSRGQSVLSGPDYATIINNSQFHELAKTSLLRPSLENYNALYHWWYAFEEIYNKPLLINRAFAACNPEDLSSTVHETKFWQVVAALKDQYGFQFTEDHQGNWYAANYQLTRWLNEQLSVVLKAKSSDSLEQNIWRNMFVWFVFEEISTPPEIRNAPLIQREKPVGLLELPTVNRSFNGVVVDYEGQARRQKALGDSGEDLVLQHERQIVLGWGQTQNVEKVRLMEDGEGYDILSFDQSGKEKFIEVKTTTGGADTPFYLSENELVFMKANTEKYWLYRIYNYNEQSNTGEFFILQPQVESQLLLQPTQYQVFIKAS